MSTNYIAPIWRMPRNANKDKLSNYSIDFRSGFSNYIDCGDSDLLSFGDSANDSPFSISGWVNADSMNRFKMIAKMDATNFEYQFGTNSTGKLSFTLYSLNTSNRIQRRYNSTAVSGVWQHWVATYDGSASASGLKIYINGVRVDDTTSSVGSYTAMQNTTATLKIGTSDLSNYVNGKINQVCIFDYALDEDQIGYLYNLNNPMAITGAEPVAYYPLGDNSNPNADAGYPNISVGADSVFDFIPNDYIDCGTTLGDSLGTYTGDLSLSYWFNTDSLTSNRGLFYIGSFSNAQGQFQVNIFSNSMRFRVDGGTQTKLLDISSLSTGTWYHILFVYKSGDISASKIYLNGEEQSTTDTGAFPSSLPLSGLKTIIGGYYGTSNTFDGEMSNVQVWDTALELSDVEDLYNSGQPLMTGTQPQEDNLKVWWKLNQTANWEADTANNWQIPDNRSAYPQSFDFDGNDDIIEGPKLNLTSAICVSFWIKTTATGTQWIVNEDRTGGTNRNWAILLASNKLNFLVYHTDGTNTQLIRSTALEVQDGEWHNVIFTWDGTTTTNAFKSFIDGGNEESTTATSSGIRNLSPYGLAIGAVQQNAGFRFDGELSNVAVWDSNQSTEISNIYNAGVPAISYTNTPTAWYKLDNTEVWENVAEQWRVKNNEITNVYYDRAGQSSFSFLSGYFNYVTTTNLTQSRTISLWIKYDINRQHPTPRTGFFNNPSLAFYSTGFREVNQASTGLVAFLVPGITLNDGGWHHILLHTRGDSTATDNIAYIDGKLANRSVTGSNSFTFGNPGVGYSNRSGNLPPAGYSFSNVVMYNGDATSNVDTLYNNGTPPEDVSSTNPDVWWKVNSTDNSVTTLEDFSGNNNDGVSTYTGPVNMVTDEWIAESGVSSGMTEQNLVNNNVSVLNGESSGMTSANLVQSNLTRKVPFSNYSYNLDGGTEYWTAGTTLGDSLGNAYTDPISVSIWINTGSLTQEQGIFSLCKNNATLDELSISLNYDFGYYWTLNANGNDAYISTGSAPIAANTWHHLLCTFEPSAIKMYVDGQQLSLSGTTTYTNLDLTGIETLIGGYYQIGVKEFLGYLSNCAVWDQILTQDDALNLYNNGVPQDLNNFRLTPIRWWSLDQNYSYWDGTNIIGRDVILGDDATGINIAQVDLEGNAPGSDANGTGANLAIADLKGNMSSSDKNAYSINMADYADGVSDPADSGRSTDVP